jgi:transposase
MKPMKYKFRLSETERAELLNIVNKGSTHTAKQIMRANVLLEMDWFYYERPWYRPQDSVASRCGVSTTTVYHISKQYVEEGLQAAINRKQRMMPPVASVVTCEKESEIIALACSPPPEGYRRWTLRLLEKKVSELGIVKQISDTTIGRVLKKHQISLKK